MVEIGGNKVVKKNSEVGYKKPPKSSQWKPGQSGNPAGKSKKPPPKLLVEEMAEQLYQPVSLTIDGKTEEVPLSRALVMSLYRDLMKAPLELKLKGMNMLREWGVLNLRDFSTGDDQYEFPQLTENDRRLLDIIRNDVGLEDDGPTGAGW